MKGNIYHGCCHTLHVQMRGELCRLENHSIDLRYQNAIQLSKISKFPEKIVKEQQYLAAHLQSLVSRASWHPPSVAGTHSPASPLEIRIRIVSGWVDVALIKVGLALSDSIVKGILVILRACTRAFRIVLEYWSTTSGHHFSSLLFW